MYMHEENHENHNYLLRSNNLKLKRQNMGG